MHLARAARGGLGRGGVLSERVRICPERACSDARFSGDRDAPGLARQVRAVHRPIQAEFRPGPRPLLLLVRSSVGLPAIFQDVDVEGDAVGDQAWVDLDVAEFVQAEQVEPAVASDDA